MNFISLRCTGLADRSACIQVDNNIAESMVHTMSTVECTVGSCWGNCAVGGMLAGTSACR